MILSKFPAIQTAIRKRKNLTLQTEGVLRNFVEIQAYNNSKLPNLRFIRGQYIYFKKNGGASEKFKNQPRSQSFALGHFKRIKTWRLSLHHFFESKTYGIGWLKKSQSTFYVKQQF